MKDAHQMACDVWNACEHGPTAAAAKLIEARDREVQLEILRTLRTWQPGEGMGGVLCERIDNAIASLESAGTGESGS